MGPKSRLAQVDPAAQSGLRATVASRHDLLDRWAAIAAGFGPSVEGFRWQPEPRLPGSSSRGRQLMAGNIRLAGSLITDGAGDPWQIPAPSLGFQRALHGFEWLDDLAAVPGREGSATAQAWLRIWIARFANGSGPGWSPDIVARRQIRWISHALFLMSGMAADDSRALLHTLGRQTGFLAWRWRKTSPGLQRFEALTGLIYAACTLVGMERYLAPALRALAQECDREIDPTGGIVTRNAEDLLEVFVLLTWVMQILAETGKDRDPAVDTAIARIAPTLRSLRHRDGGLARFHGGGRGMPGRMVLALAQSRVPPSTVRGLAMGYARLATETTSILIDAAPPMLGPGSTGAHASTLAFEMTFRTEPVIVNCGPGEGFGPAWRRAARATASHSTLCLDGYTRRAFPTTQSGIPRMHNPLRTVRPRLPFRKPASRMQTELPCHMTAGAPPMACCTCAASRCMKAGRFCAGKTDLRP